jgi:hypothetical protein
MDASFRFYVMRLTHDLAGAAKPAARLLFHRHPRVRQRRKARREVRPIRAEIARP